MASVEPGHDAAVDAIGPRNLALDGVRGLAILLVVVSHARVPLVRHGANAGLTVFFVLSGFLITSLLVRELRTYGSVSIKAFYARRALRLLPALVFVLGCTALANLVVQIYPQQDVWLSSLMSLFYVANLGVLVDVQAGYTRFLWSLSLEEQFYLLWPLAMIGFFALRRRRRPAGDRAPTAADLDLLIGLLLGAATISVLWRFTGPIGTLEGFERSYYLPHTSVFSILVGSATALWVRRRPVGPSPVPALVSLAIILVVSTLVGLRSGLREAPGELSFVIRLAVGPVCTVPAAVLVAFLASHPASGLLRAFAHPMMVFFGRISYSLYLWHAFGIDLVGHLAGVGGEVASVRGTAASLVGVGVATGLATLTFRYVEQPFMRRKHRFERVNLVTAPAVSPAGDPGSR